MTPLEHGFVGFNASVALGIHRLAGWKGVAIGTFVAMVPDWDWLACLWGEEAFSAIHRVWGHALVSCLATAFVCAVCDYYFDLVGRTAAGFNRLLPKRVRKPEIPIRSEFTRFGLMQWFLIVLTVLLTHPLADLFVTGGVDFPPWPVQLFWPFSTRPYTFPLIHWGDYHVFMIFGLGLAAMIVRRKWSRPIAFGVFIALALYALIW